MDEQQFIERLTRRVKREMEWKLGTTEAWFSTTLDCVSEAVIGIDPHGAVEFMNAAAERLTGCAFNVVRYVPVANILQLAAAGTDRPSDPLARVLAGENDTNANGQYWLHARRRDAAVLVDLSIAACRYQSGMLGAVMVLRRVPALVTGGGDPAAVAAIAHDLNNLFTTMLGWSDLLEKNSPGASACTSIGAAVRAASALSQRLLAIGRNDLAAPGVFDLRVPIRELAGLFASILEPRSRLNIDLPEQELPVSGDRMQLEQVLLNLTINARDAMPEGGVLSIAVRRHSREFVELTVSDTGPGMDAQTRERLFEPFFSRKGNGQGMGMTIVQRVVSEWKGHIDVESEPGHGTTFRILLPLPPRRPGEAAH
jgi:signal transduction histidine kinase